ncbi:MAG: hypothetical protein IJB95_04185, partial [Clostridia bacterium]|nr:hypothetical protein [Clostridia bacterium]
NAFRACSRLTSVTFSDPNGWYVTTTEGATSGISLTLTNPGYNAFYLSNDGHNSYLSYYWYKKAN